MRQRQSGFYVSRQWYYYQGIKAVELAVGGIDYSGCDQLVTGAYGKWAGDYADPVEAAEAAIALRDSWQSAEDERVCLVYGVNLDLCEGESDEEATPEQEATELRAWAGAYRESMPKCDHCGELLGTETWQVDCDPDLGQYCREYCADEAAREYFGEEVEEAA